MTVKERISMTIDPDLLQRLDAVCEARGDTRSAVLERIVRNEIEKEEEFVRDMESPVVRFLAKALVQTPGILEIMAKVIAEDMTPEDFEAIREQLPLQLERGRARQQKHTAKHPHPHHQSENQGQGGPDHAGEVSFA